MDDDVIEASDLLKSHVQMVSDQARQRIMEAAQSEAEMRGIDTNEYRFDPNRMMFVEKSGEQQGIERQSR